MAARLRYPELAPEGYAALSAFGHYVNTATALEPVLLGLVYLRASVLNGCHFCIEMHKAELRKHHEPESRIEAAGEAPTSAAFTGRERAALAWTEVITHLGPDGASEEAYAAVSVYFSGKSLVDLTFAIANINAWNRMGVAFRPAWRPKAEDAGAKMATEPREPVRHVASDKVEARAPEAGSSAAPAQEAAREAQPSPEGGTASANEDDGGKVGTD